MATHLVGVRGGGRGHWRHPVEEGAALVGGEGVEEREAHDPEGGLEVRLRRDRHHPDRRHCRDQEHREPQGLGAPDEARAGGRKDAEGNQRRERGTDRSTTRQLKTTLHVMSCHAAQAMDVTAAAPA